MANGALEIYNGTAWLSIGSGTVKSITAGTGLTGGTITDTGTIDLANTAVTAGAYTYASITIDGQGRATAASNGVAPVTTVTGTANQVTITGTTTPTIAIAVDPIFTGNVICNGTGFTRIAAGTTLQRPSNPQAGDIRFNTSL